MRLARDVFVPASPPIFDPPEFRPARGPGGNKPDAIAVMNMDAYEKQLRAREATLPGKRSRDGSLSISWVTLASELKMDPALLSAKHISYRPRVEFWARHFPVEDRAVAQFKPLTLDEFAKIAYEHRRFELESADLDPEAGNLCLSAMSAAIAAVNSVNSPKANLIGLLSLASEGNLAGDVKREIDRLKGYLADWAMNRNLPRNPAHLLRYAMDRKGLTAAVLARHVNIEAAPISAWLNGSKLPQATRRRDGHRIEKALDLPEGAWWNAVMTAHLSRREAAAAKPNPYGNACQLRFALPYCHHDWSSRLEREYDDWAEYRTTPLLEEDIARTGKAWRSTTLLMARSYLSMVYGTFTTDQNDVFRIDPDDLTIAYFVFPQLIRTRLKFMMKRMQMATGIAKPGITKWELDQLTFIRSLLNVETGWITQKPELADRLKPVVGFDGKIIISEKEIEAARANWVNACGSAHKKYLEIQRSHREFVVQSRNPHEPVLPILAMDNPLAAFAMLCESLQADPRASSEDLMEQALWSRDMVIAGILTQAAFRPLTLHSLNLAHLVYEKAEEAWYLRVPGNLFKNEDGAYFGSQRKSTAVPKYEKKLDDHHGLYAAIDDYLVRGRPLFLGQTVTDALIVCLPHGHPGLRAQQGDCERGRISTSHLRRIVKVMTAKHLGYDEATGKGLPGVTSFPIQAFRYILATGVLKMSAAPDELGRWKDAAYAIHDGIRTVAAYAQYLPQDRAAAVQDCIQRGFLKGCKLKAL